jgi:HK97 family phage portal protein
VRSPLRALVAPLAARNRAPVPVGTSGSSSQISLATFARSGYDDERLMATFGQNGTVHAIVTKCASGTASAEWKLWRKALSGKPEDRIEVTKHAALDLWNKPNPFMARQEFVESSQQYIDLVGEADLVLSYGFNIPIEMWPVRPDRVDPVPDKYDFLKGYIYRGPEGDQVPLELKECLQIKLPNPWDPYSGLVPIQSILSQIDASRYSAEWNKNFFLNSAEPGGVIEVDHELDDREFDQLRDRWAETHKGVSKAHRVAILENGAKWVSRNQTMRDMQFAELRGVSRDAILEAFGFPKPILGIVENVNRANAEAAEYLFAKWLLVPRLERWKAMLNHELLPLFGGAAEGLEFDYESPVAENSETENAALTARFNAAVAAVGAGFDSVEVLKACGLPDIAFSKPEPKIIQAPPAPGEQGKPGDDPNLKNLQNLIRLDNAMKWIAQEHIDDNTCDPCKENDGKLYRNRADAYADYPDGKSFRLCVGEKFGNHCRGTVVKRRKGGDDED